MAERFAFDVEWHDQKSEQTYLLQLLVTPSESVVELFEPARKRMFLKRTHCPDVKLEQLFVGATVVLLSRALRIVGYADEYTRTRLSARRESVFLCVKALQHCGAVLSAAQSRASLVLVNAKVGVLSAADPQRLSGEATSRQCFAFELLSHSGHAAQALRAALGQPTFGWWSIGQEAVDDAAFFFSAQVACTSRGVCSSLAVVKPHAVHAGSAGAILEALQNAFLVTGAAVRCLDKAQASSFLTIYDGVAPDFAHMVEELASGPVLALEVVARHSGDAECIVQQLRELAGPSDPDLARVLRPSSLRAQYGVDGVKNALHVTDLESDGSIEVAAFMHTLA